MALPWPSTCTDWLPGGLLSPVRASDRRDPQLARGRWFCSLIVTLQNSSRPFPPGAPVCEAGHLYETSYRGVHPPALLYSPLSNSHVVKVLFGGGVCSFFLRLKSVLFFRTSA